MRMASSDDTVKLDMLLGLSWDLRNTAPEEALSYGQEAMELALKVQDMERYVQAHSYVGTIYRVLGDYNKATDIFFNGLDLARKHQIKEGEGYALINIGNLYIYLEYYANAIDYLKQAEKIAVELNHKGMLAYVLLNKGRASLYLKDYEKALEYILQSLDLRIELGNKEAQAVCLKYLGDIYVKKSDGEKAKFYYEQARQLCPIDSQKDLLGSIYLQLANVSLGERNLKSALNHADQALGVGKEINSRMIIRDALKVKSEISLQLNDHKSAAIELSKVIQYNDTLFNQQLSEKISNLEVQYERQKRQIEIDLLNKEREIKELKLSKNRAVIFGLVLALAIMAVTGSFLIFLMRKVRRQNKTLKSQKAELTRVNLAKDKMFMVIGHDLRGPIGSCKALLELLLEDAELSNNEDQIETLNVLIQSAQSVGSLLENLLLWAKNQGGEIAFQPVPLSMNAILDQTVSLHKTLFAQKRIDLRVKFDKEYLVTADHNMLSTIFRNLISNSIKFSHQDGKIEIFDHEVVDNMVVVAVKDNGVGFDEKIMDIIFSQDNYITTIGTKNEIGSGLGLSICKEFVERNGGKIWAESSPGKGSTFYFSLPLAPVKWK